MLTCDVLIIGSGLAAFTTALHLAEDRKIILLTKRGLADGASQWAQGGIAAVMSTEDSVEHHVQDTLRAGAGLCDEAATRFVVEQSRPMADWLIGLGVPFSREGKAFHLTREGGHSRRRVLHAQDATGRAVQSVLAKQVASHPNITVLEHHLAIDLITGRAVGRSERQVFGAYALDTVNGHVKTFAAGNTVLATGGAGKVYLYTTNPDTATGDGIAMAWRAGCRVGNMEFIQFHPTCLYHPRAKSFLISEAVRGEGGVLKLPDGDRFMARHDPRGELAPRDIVARAIDFEMKKRGLDHVYLDISHQSADFILDHFPTIYQRCREFGIDITREPIPVVPAAHYTCGGVATDPDARTDLANLYAVGEVSFTGLHGANRLASNSLLECLVFGRAAAHHMQESEPAPPATLPDWDESRVTDADEQVVIAHNWAELRRFMWDYVGIVRTTKRLTRAARRIRLLQEEIDEYYRHFRISHDLIELRNLVMTADLIVRSALLRHESRGLHYSRDYPDTMPIAGNTVLNPRPDLICPGTCDAPMDGYET